jgi:hypothetical protein
VLLAGYGNVPAGRTADLIGMLLGMPVSAGFVDKAASRLDGRLRDAGFDDAMQAALAAEPALGADETRSACSPPSKTRTPASRATGPRTCLSSARPAGS